MRGAGGGFAAIYAAAAWLWLGGNLVYAAGVFGWLHPAALVFLAILIAGGLVAIGVLAVSARRAFAAAVSDNLLLSCVLAATVLAAVYLGLSPPTARDALIHHLALPRIFLEAGRVVDVPYALHAAYPQMVDMLYLLPVGLGADWAAAWIHLGFGLLAAAVLAARARVWAGNTAGIVAAILFLGLPVVLRLGSVAYVDLALCLYTFLALECFLRWRENGNKGHWLTLSALAVGFAISTKYQGFMSAAVIGALVVLVALRRDGLARATRHALLFGLIAILPAAPWLIRNVQLHGNPVYPLFSQTLGATPEQAAESTHPLRLRRIAYGESILAIAALPIRIFISGREDDPRRFDGRLNPFLPFLAAGVLLLRKRGERVSGGGLVTLFAVCGVLLALGTQVARVRYVLPFVGVLCPLAAAAVTVNRGRMLMGGMFAAAMLWNGLFLAGAVREADLLPYLAGRESREAYLSRRLAAYPLYALANERVPAEGRVQLLFMGDRGYYLDVPYTYEPYFSGVGLAEALRNGPNGAATYFDDRDVTHLLANEALLRRYLRGRLGSAGVSRFEAFANAWTTKLDRRGAYALYEIHKSKRDQGLGSGMRVKFPSQDADKSRMVR